MSTSDILLDFNLLDDLALAVERNNVAMEDLPKINTEELGPLVEAISLASEWRHRELASFDWLNKGVFNELFTDAITQQTRTQFTGNSTGWLSADTFADDTPWTGFLMRVSAAIKNSGFDTRTKQAIMATFGEFRSNVIEHAGRNDGVLVAFHSYLTSFELVIADRGRGVLDSIKEIPAHENLNDVGQALKLTVTDGVSRHNDPQRGHGFSHLFEGLANRFNHIRLRSGDHALEVFRENNAPPTERISQKAHIPGLFIYARFNKNK